MCEVEAAIGARSHVVPEVKAAPGVSAVSWLLFVSVAPPLPSRHCAHVYAHRLARLPGGRPGPTYYQETREQMLHARANVHAASELVA
jgi:hypothetical protein